MRLDERSVNELRSILSKELKRNVTFEEAKLYGEWLLKFYSHLLNKCRQKGV